MTQPVDLADSLAIVGIGETEYKRAGTKPVSELILEAIEAALTDAGICARDVDGFVTEGLVAPAVAPHDEVAATLGVPDFYSSTISVAGAGIVCTPLLAAQAMACGQGSIFVSYFGVDWGSRAGAAYDAFAREESPKECFEKPYGYYGQPMYFAALAQRYKHCFGVDLERALGTIAVQERSNALLNGRAQMSKPLSREEYLDSPYIADPLRLPDCCLLTDGAAAFVMVPSDRAKDFRQRPVYFKGAGLAAVPIGTDSFFSQNPEFLSWPSARPATEKALSMARIGLEEVDFAELYDCSTITCLMELEDVGFCGKGEAADFIGDGTRIAIDGALPLNTHGGLLSHSYLLGMSHIAEAVRQLRHEAGAAQVPDAKIGLVTGLAVPYYGTLILGRDDA